MCECGCGETRPLVKLPAPNGGWYALEVYPGCENCGNEFWGVTVVLFKKGDEDGKHVLHGVPRIAFDSYERWDEIILDFDVLRKHFANHGGEDELAEPDIAPMFALNEMLRSSSMRSVYYDTLKKTEADEQRRKLIQRERSSGESNG